MRPPFLMGLSYLPIKIIWTFRPNLTKSLIMQQTMVILLTLCVNLTLVAQLPTLIDKDGQLTPPVTQLLQVLSLDALKTPEAVFDYTQAQWLRSGERWQIKTSPFQERLEASIPAFRALQMVDAIEPKETIYNHLLVLGATVPLMEAKILWVLKKHQEGFSFEQIHILTGERPLDPAVDSLVAMEALPQEEKPKTEGEAAVWLWNHHVTDPVLRKNVHFIRVPMLRTPVGGVRRPTTADTLHYWLDTQPVVGRALVLSKNPHIGYQDAVIGSILGKNWLKEGGSFETVGEASPSWAEGTRYRERAMGVFLDTFARWFYESFKAYQANKSTENTQKDKLQEPQCSH